MNIIDLNDDCFSVILSLIPFNELILKRIVCKNWKNRIDLYVNQLTHFTYTKKLNCIVTDSGVIMPKKTSNGALFQGLNELNVADDADDEYFYRFHNRIDSLINLSQFNTCMSHVTNIVSLTLDGVFANDAIIPIIALHCPRITKLRLMSGEGTLSLIGIRHLVYNFPQITHLEVPNCQLDDDLLFIIVSNLRNLQHFNFSTDRRGSNRLSRFTGLTLRYVTPKLRSLMIGESMYWDQNLVTNLITGAKHVTILKIHLIKLKSLKDVCDNMLQLKEFYCSFNGGDINSHDRNIGCVKHIGKLKKLRVLELTDDGRHHCNANGCSSVYTKESLLEIVKNCTELRTLKLIDYDNWHSTVPEVNSVLNDIREFCPKLISFGISAGLFDLRAESYGLIGSMNLINLQVQGDTSLAEGGATPHRQNHITNDVMVNLVKSSKKLISLTIENCHRIGKDTLIACLDEARQREREWFNYRFINTRMTPNVLAEVNVPRNVELSIINTDDDINSDSDESFSINSSINSLDSDGDVHIQLWDDSDDSSDINDDIVNFVG